MNRSLLALAFLMFSCPCSLCFAATAEAAAALGHEEQETFAPISVGMPLKDGLHMLQRCPDVEAVEPYTGDVAPRDGDMIIMVTWKQSGDALFLIATPQNEQGAYLISELIIYRHWKTDCTKPKKMRAGKTERVPVFPLP